MICWITGNSGSGKSTLAKKILKTDGGVWLDGDSMRSVWTLGFSKEDRVEHNLRIAKLARMLDDQGLNIVVSTICPYRDLRSEVQKITRCRFIYLDGGLSGPEHPYEV